MLNDTQKYLRCIRKQLKKRLPQVKNSHIAESLAFSMGFKTAIALNVWSNTGEKLYLPANHQAFIDRLTRFNYKPEEYWQSWFLNDAIICALIEQYFLKHCSIKKIAEFSNYLLDTEELDCEPYYWQTRGKQLSEVLFDILCYQRDHQKIRLELDRIYGLTRFKNLCFLSKEPGNLPEDIRNKVDQYLQSLPDYDYSKGWNKQSQTTMDFHAYLEMRFSKNFSSLKDMIGSSDLLQISLACLYRNKSPNKSLVAKSP